MAVHKGDALPTNMSNNMHTIHFMKMINIIFIKLANTFEHASSIIY